MLSTLALQLPSLFESFSKSTKKVEVKLGILAIKNQVSTYLETDSIWEATFNHPLNNTAFDCIKNPANACNSNSSFQIFNPSGVALTEAIDNKPGFNDGGDTCAGFDLVNGNKDCPVGIALSFEKVCGTPCKRPSMKITVNYQYSGVKGITLNARNLSTKIFKLFKASNVIAHDDIRDISAGNLYIHPSGVRQTEKIIQRTIVLDEEAVIVVAGSGGARLLQTGPPTAINIRSKNNQIVLEINGQVVASNRTASLARYPNAGSRQSQRYLTSGWTQKVGPGNVTIRLRYTAWCTWETMPLIIPSMQFLHLAYTVVR